MSANLARYVRQAYEVETARGALRTAGLDNLAEPLSELLETIWSRFEDHRLYLLWQPDTEFRVVKYVDKAFYSSWGAGDDPPYQFSQTEKRWVQARIGFKDDLRELKR